MVHQSIQRNGRPFIFKLLGRFVPTFMAAGLFCIFVFSDVLAVVSQSSLETVTKPAIDVDGDVDRTEAGRLKFKADVHLTVVPISVTDSSDHPITGLEPRAFRLFEDNVEQKIEYFSTEEGPLSAVIIFDASGSMKEKLEPSVAAIKLLAETGVKGDELSLVRFSDRPQLLAGFTNNPEEILQKLLFLEPKGWTAMRDAIFLAVHQMKFAKNSSRVLLVLSDGADNNSRHSESETRNLVLESDVRVYSIELFNHSRFLDRITADTGGEAFVVQDLQDLPQAVAKMSRTLRTHYLVAYYSKNPLNDGRYRKIRVQVTSPFQQESLVVRWRTGYYAGSQ